MKSGIVAVTGRPNVGKSSLLNRLVGVHLAAVSKRPQTTWAAMRGVMSEEGGQIVFVDTPGLHAARGAMNQAMVTAAAEAIAGADAILWVVEATGLTPQDRRLAPAILEIAGQRPLLVALNKCDLVAPDAVLPLIAVLNDAGVRNLIPVSAHSGANLESLRAALLAAVPEGEPMFPDQELSDRPLRYFAAEFIRQAAFETLHDELPYSLFVEIEDFLEDREPVLVRATLYVERESQKRIVIGEGGRQIKEIGRRARVLLADLMARSVFLELWVKVLPKWTKREAQLKRAGLVVEPKRRQRVAALTMRLGGALDSESPAPIREGT